jgi:rhamnose utilization protein RhaD (predicted bifunctional aldolase and dehydrogenase)
MIDAVSLAEQYLEQSASVVLDRLEPREWDTQRLQIEEYRHINQTPLALHYASMDNLRDRATRGVLTPEHIIRTKRVPLVIEDGEVEDMLERYRADYKSYFQTYKTDEIMLDPNPKYAVIKGFGIITFGKSQKEADIINDIIEHTMRATLRADKLGGYQSISIADSFAMEYWELEQAKLK